MKLESACDFSTHMHDLWSSWRLSASVRLIRHCIFNLECISSIRMQRFTPKHACGVFVLGWPGAPYSVDICEGLEDWSGANSLSNPSDTEEEDAALLVRDEHPTLAQSLIHVGWHLSFFTCSSVCFRLQADTGPSSTGVKMGQTSSLSVAMSYNYSMRKMMASGEWCVRYSGRTATIQNNNSVIIYSPSCCSKPLWLNIK